MQDFVHPTEGRVDKGLKKRNIIYTNLYLNFDRNEPSSLGGYFLYKHFDIVAIETARVALIGIYSLCRGYS